MDTAVIKSNKENSKPEAGPKNKESRNVISKQKLMRPAPLRSKNDFGEDHAGDKAKCKAQAKPAFCTEQTLRHRKLVLESQKPPSSVPPKPVLPGTYKGRVVQSKIDCFRKPLNGHEKKSSENKTKAETKPATTLPASSRAEVQSSVVGRTKSVSDTRVNMQKMVTQRRIQMKASARTATISTNLSSTISTKPSTVSAKPSTVSAKPSTVSTKPSTVTTKPSTVSAKPSTVSAKPSTVSAKPSTVSTKPSIIATKPSAVSRKPVTMSARPPAVTSFIKMKGPSKPAVAASEQKPQKAGFTSISQYRIRVESAEERRAKLAEWLASKGKTLKRPVMTEKPVPQTCKPQAEDVTVILPEVSEGAKEEMVQVMEQREVPQRKPVFSSSPSHILNTTLDLLDNSDTEVHTEPEIRMESLVINLCERLELMETPSTCRSDVKADENGGANVKVEEETPEYEILEEEELGEEKLLNSIAVEKKEEEKKTLKVEQEDEEKVLTGDEEEDEDEQMDSTPADVLDACVVKYSVKTTPFLQSVKKRIECEMVPGTPGSRRKSSIKELKFLTPVRRSSRIHRNSSRLPGVLNEHDPCVSSLAELELVDSADSNAYIYRRNPALLQHLPDQCPESLNAHQACK